MIFLLIFISIVVSLDLENECINTSSLSPIDLNFPLLV